MEPEYFIRHQELCKDEINVKKGWKNYLKKLNKLKNKTFNLSHLLFYLPACRRLLFPLLHAEKGRRPFSACNKGNRRSLRAGNCSTRLFFSMDSFDKGSAKARGRRGTACSRRSNSKGGEQNKIKKPRYSSRSECLEEARRGRVEGAPNEIGRTY